MPQNRRTYRAFETMMLFVVVCVGVLVLCTAAEKLHLTLEPALDFHEALGNSGERLFFRIVQPQAVNSCTEQPARCNGGFALELGMYDGIEISFQAPKGKEIRVFSSQVNNISQSHRVTVMFLAKADCVLAGNLPLVVKDFAFTPEIVGSNVEALVANYNASNSFMEVGKCQKEASRIDYCTKRRECQIFTSLDFWADDASFQGTISKITWSVTYDRSIFGHAGELDFRYDTDGLQGYTWIQTPFRGALVPASPTKASASTASPTSGSDSLPSLVCILSASVFALLLL